MKKVLTPKELHTFLDEYNSLPSSRYDKLQFSLVGLGSWAEVGPYVNLQHGVHLCSIGNQMAGVPDSFYLTCIGACARTKITIPLTDVSQTELELLKAEPLTRPTKTSRGIDWKVILETQAFGSVYVYLRHTFWAKKPAVWKEFTDAYSELVGRYLQ